MKLKMNILKLIIPTLLLFSCVAKVTSQAHAFAFLMKLIVGDKTPPQISFTSPAPIDNEFEINKSFTIVFSEPIYPQTGTPLRLSLNDVEVRGTAEFINTSLLFTPETNLNPNTKYSVNIAGVADKSGNGMASVYNYSFTTGNSIDTTPISIKQTIPATDAKDVYLNARIGIEFSETIHPHSIIKSNFLLKAGGKM